ncbi:hypothetical protein JW933_02515 [candidate division FCPU426 bacterium]|nr:hypothetical protein [candidate division FCPU426 bacterium]
MDPYSTQMLMLNQLGHLSSSFIEYVRSVLFALVWLVVGLIVAEVSKHILAALLRVVRWDAMSSRLGLTRALGKIRTEVKPSQSVGEIAFWLILFSFFMKSLIISNINFLTGLGRAYFDNIGGIFQSLFVLLISLLLAQWIARLVCVLVEGAGALLAAGMGRALVVSLGIYASLHLLGWEKELLLPLVIVLFSGAQLALALNWAFKSGKTYRQVIRIEECEEVSTGL